MSWQFAIHQLDQHLQKLLHWFQELRRQTEAAFHAMNRRVEDLEQRSAVSDEQLERVLRRILAERFSAPPSPGSDGRQRTPPGRPNGRASTRPPYRPFDDVFDSPPHVNISPEAFAIDPFKMPSEGFRKDLEMLEGHAVGRSGSLDQSVDRKRVSPSDDAEGADYPLDHLSSRSYDTNTWS